MTSNCLNCGRKLLVSGKFCYHNKACRNARRRLHYKNNPEYRGKLQKKVRKAWREKYKDPEFRKKRSEAKKAMRKRNHVPVGPAIHIPKIEIIEKAEKVLNLPRGAGGMIE